MKLRLVFSSTKHTIWPPLLTPPNCLCSFLLFPLPKPIKYPLKDRSFLHVSQFLEFETMNDQTSCPTRIIFDTGALVLLGNALSLVWHFHRGSTFREWMNNIRIMVPHHAATFAS